MATERGMSTPPMLYIGAWSTLPFLLNKMLYMQQIHTQRTKQRKDMKSIIHWPTNKWQTKDITLLTKNVKSVKRNNDYCPK